MPRDIAAALMLLRRRRLRYAALFFFARLPELAVMPRHDAAEFVYMSPRAP